MSATPAPEIITAKLNTFVEKWKDAQDCNGRYVFTSDTVEATKKLKHHISTGCISYIPPGAGTNRNECFHKQINSLFNRSKMGILLAYALLTVLIHAHNSSEKIHGRFVIRPLVASGSPACVTKPIGIMPKVREEQYLQNSSHCEIDVTENVMDMQLIVPIYIRSMQKHQIMKVLGAMGLSRLQNSANCFTPFQPSVVAASELSGLTTSCKLPEYGLTFASAPPDGNCFFSAVGINMMADLEMWKHCLTIAGISNCVGLNVQTLATILRQAFVRELLGERRVNYEPFVDHTDLDYCVEANRFKQDGYYNSELGNTMPLVLATALQFSIVLFSTDPNTPTMYVTPDVVTTEVSAFLVYTPFGQGHYDAAIPCHKVSRQTSCNELKPTSCRCGVNNKKLTAQSCTPCPIYTTRCTCYKASRPCTSLCRCTNCENPCGQRPPPLLAKKRIRRKHDLQIDIPSSKRFAQERGEHISEGIWSSFESTVLHDICTSLQQETDSGIITKLYNDIVYYSTSSYCLVALPSDVVFRKKSILQITSKINYTAVHTFSH